MKIGQASSLGPSSTKLQLLADLKQCSTGRNLQWGKQVHAEAVECGLHTDIYLSSALINMYAKCGCMASAQQIFDSLSHPNVVSWTVLILGYADNGQALTALKLFIRMKTHGPAANSVTFLAALKACISLAVKGGASECSKRGRKVHNLASESGCDSDVNVQSTLIVMYSKCGSMDDARQVFETMKHPDVVSWTALILGYAENGQGYNALALFSSMKSRGPAPNAVTFLAGIKGCTSVAVTGGASEWAECKEWGREIHDLARNSGLDSDIFVKNTLIDMYSKCASMAEAQEVFDSIQHPDVISWSALILGYADNGQGLRALELFMKMRTGHPSPNSVTFLAALKACGLVGGLEFGRTIHSEIERADSFDVVLVTCLVDFYAKCGSLIEARRVFDLHTSARDIVAWSTLLSGYSNTGDHEAVFGLYEEMQEAGLVPNSATFLCILTCCNHAGLVEKGKECFEEMSVKYGVTPTLEHYTCMVDLLGRSNKLDGAMALLQCMPCSPDDVIWRTILGSCRNWKNVELGMLVFQALIRLNDGDAAAFVLMEQLYGSKDMFQEQATVMGMRRQLKSWKVPGKTCWTNEVGEVHSFVVDDSWA